MHIITRKAASPGSLNSSIRQRCPFPTESMLGFSRICYARGHLGRSPVALLAMLVRLAAAAGTHVTLGVNSIETVCMRHNLVICELPTADSSVSRGTSGSSLAIFSRCLQLICQLTGGGSYQC